VDQPERLRRARHDRPDRREAGFPFGQEPIRIPERPDQRHEVRTSDLDVIEHHDRRSRLPSNATEKPGQNFHDREPPAVESFVQTLQQCARDSVRAAQVGDAKGEKPGGGFARARAEPVRYLPRRATRDDRGSGSGRSGHSHDPRRTRSRNGWVESSDHLPHLVTTTDRYGRQPFVRQDLGAEGTHHGELYNY